MYCQQVQGTVYVPVYMFVQPEFTYVESVVKAVFCILMLNPFIIPGSAVITLNPILATSALIIQPAAVISAAVKSICVLAPPQYVANG